MTDKVQKIREEVARLLNHVKDSNFESDSGAFYYLKDLLDFIDSMQEEPTTSVWHSAKDEEPIKGRKIVVLTSVCNIADKNISFTGEYIGNGYVQVFNAKEYMNSWAKWAYIDDLIKL